MSIRSVQARGILYSLPLPITIALLALPREDTSSLYFGIPLLTAFLFIVALVEPRVGRFLAVLCGLFAYIGVAGAVHKWVSFQDWLALAVSSLLLALMSILGSRVKRKATKVSQGSPGILEYVAVPAVTSATWTLGSILGPFLVTFPYSGVPTALAMRSGHLALAVGFSGQAWLLLGFVAIVDLTRTSTDLAFSLFLAWIAFLAGTWARVRHPVVRRTIHRAQCFFRCESDRT